MPSLKPRGEVERCTCECGCSAHAEKDLDFCRDCASGSCPPERLHPTTPVNRAMPSPRSNR